MSSNRPATIGELKKSDYRPRSVRDELRDNIRNALRNKEDLFPGIVGFEKTVIPQVVGALLSRHDMILLGLRGQAKTRLARQLTAYLDPFVPVLSGFPLNEDPLSPISTGARDRIRELGDDTPISWLSREERYHEKLATPDVTMSDLIGDIDPIKAANKRLDLSSEEVIHFGIIPRTHRGIFCINELPDLAARIQVGLLNILQERDIQIRGFPIRLPIDVLMIFTANPEDYTNRGSIITPLKDRIASQILTHYPKSVEQSQQITRQEAWTERRSDVNVYVPVWLQEVVEAVAFEARKSEFLDPSSGVSARLPIALLENLISNAERRAWVHGVDQTTVRPVDFQPAVSAVTGKIELVYEGEQEGALNVARHLVGRALKTVFDKLLPDIAENKKEEGFGPYKPVIQFFAQGGRLEISDESADADTCKALMNIPGLSELARDHVPMSDEKRELGAAMELVLEGLHQSRMLAKDDLENGSAYRDMLGSMFEGMDLGGPPPPRERGRGRK